MSHTTSWFLVCWFYSGTWCHIIGVFPDSILTSQGVIAFLKGIIN